MSRADDGQNAAPATRGVFTHASFLLRALALLMLVLPSFICLAQPTRVTVGIVTDGPTDRDIFSAAMIERELANIIAGDVAIVLPQDKRLAGDWTSPGVATALDRALADAAIDVVVTVGVLASHEAAHRQRLAKPVVASLVIDPILQRYPLTEGNSGRTNFTYVADFRRVEEDVRAFHRVVGFERLVMLADESLLRAIPELAQKVDQIATALGVRIKTVPTTGDAQATLAAIPRDADAVFVGGLLRFSAADVSELAKGLIERRLPSFSIVGRSEVESGLLMTTGGAQRDVERLARRIILTVQRVAGGDDAASIEVAFPTEQRALLNMRTARAIDFSPRWEDLSDAEQIDAERTDELEPVTLAGAMQAALNVNPALAATRARLDSSADDIRIARSSLLPTLDAAASQTTIDADRASPVGQAEETRSAQLTFQQVLYSDRAWANYSISQSLHEASKQGQRQDTLDTLQSVASAYLDVLRAKAAESVRYANVENTRKNLEIARVRETVGLAGRSDHLRWVSQLARDKQELLSAQAVRRQAETELARLMHRSSDAPFTTIETDLDSPLALVSSPRLRALLDTPAKWDAFTAFAVGAALETSPEISQASAYVASRERAVTAARRSFYLPEVALVTSGSKSLDRYGVGATSSLGAPDDESWSVSLQVSMPIFTGRQRSAELSQAGHELRASRADRANASDAVEARARAALHRTAGSYPAIALSAQAEAAANENLTMVTDAYARGAVSVTDLIDAQDTALNSRLAAADARYTFVTDFVAVLRAMNDFDLLLDRWSRETWLKRVEDGIRDNSIGARTARR